MEDKKALKILLDAYWSSNGWKNGQVNREDYEYAKTKGYMFDPVILKHDELIGDIKTLINNINLETVVKAFLYSLSTRKLEYRSALGSYVIANSMPLHSLKTKFCEVCGEYSEIKIDRNVLNFERFKWGGVRHLNPEYIWFDLKQFINLPPVIPSSEDRILLNRIIEKVYELEVNDKVRKLEKAISKDVKSNKEEREVIIQILSYCSILENPNYPGFKDCFASFSERPDPVEHSNDWSYPSFTWKAEYRFNKNAFNYYFRDYS